MTEASDVTKRYFAPLPQTWGRVYRQLQLLRRRIGDPRIPPPPVALILGGWSVSSGLQKHQRWQETIAWARDYGFEAVIDEVQATCLEDVSDDRGWVPDPVWSKPGSGRALTEPHLGLFCAVEQGDLRATKDALERHADPDASGWTNGMTALHVAAQKGKPRLAELLLSAGSDASLRDEYGRTPAAVALDLANWRLVRVFIRKGSATFNDLFEHAMETGNVRMAGLLWSELGPAAQNTSYVDWDQFKGATPYLAAAVRRQDSKLVQFLLSVGGDPRWRDATGDTLLHRCLSRSVAGVLLKWGADPNVLNRNGDTAVDVAQRANVQDVADLLKRRGGRSRADVIDGAPRGPNG